MVAKNQCVRCGDEKELSEYTSYGNQYNVQCRGCGDKHGSTPYTDHIIFKNIYYSKVRLTDGPVKSFEEACKEDA